MSQAQKEALAYLIGVALGDGNLSNPNGRAIRLRITCDTRYPKVTEKIVETLRFLLPQNKVSIVRVPNKHSYANISVYSNMFAQWLPWKVGAGTKFAQQARVPAWVKEEVLYTQACLRGLFQTDGSIYYDRGYLMVNFTNHTQVLADDVYTMTSSLGFRPTLSLTRTKNGQTKYTVRVVRNAADLVDTIRLAKA